MRSLRAFALLLLCLISAAPSSAGSVEQAVVFRAIQKNDGELTRAIQVIAAKGFLTEIIEVVTSQGQSGGVERVKEVARNYLQSEAKVLYGVGLRPLSNISVTAVNWIPGNTSATVTAVGEVRATHAPLRRYTCTLTVDTIAFTVVRFDSTQLL